MMPIEADPVSTPGADDDAKQRLEVAFALVAETVGELTSSGRQATGSEVRLALKARTYGGFDPRALGFRRFRAFLSAAAERGVVEVDERRRGDVAVRLPGVAGAAPEAPREVRGDLWRAFLDWGPDELRLFDIDADRVLRLPKEPAPLEPERFGAIRRRRLESPETLVEISGVSRQQLTDWMLDFAASREPTLRDLLVRSLEGDKPTKTFLQIVRALPEEHARWNEALLLRLRPVIEAWRDANSLTISIDRSMPRDDVEMPPIAAHASEEGTTPSSPRRWALSDVRVAAAPEDVARTAITAAFRTAERGRSWAFVRPAGSSLATPSDEVELRRRLHEAIDRMPPEELRKIALPVGYLFGR